MSELIFVMDDGKIREANEQEKAEIIARRALAALPVVPQTVTRRQALQALFLAGKLDMVAPAINAIPDPVQRGLAQIEWENATDFDRGRQLTIKIGGALGLDDAALDALFIQAGTL